MYDFKFADIGEGIHEGQILKWNFKIGDTVKEGDTLVVVETDKVNAEIPSPVDGVLKKLGAEEGDVINVGETLAIIDDGSGGDVPEEPEVKEEKPEKKKSSGVVGDIEESDEVIASFTETRTETTTERVLATPVARKLARDLNIDINEVKGTGENNRVLKTDIENHQQAQKPTPRPASVSGEGDRREPISRTRKAIVNAMTNSKAIIPHSTLTDEVIVDNLVSFRREQKEIAAEKGIKLTYLPFIIKAITLSIKEYPIFNASFDHETDEIIYHNNINIGIAVDTPEGLIVPNIKNADQKSIFTLAEELGTLATAARDRTLQLADIQNGTFTITNFGSFDTSFGAPVINHPEVGIIGIGKIAKKPIVVDDEIKIGQLLPLSLAFDHRIIDGADAGRFLIRVKQYLSDPMLLLMS